MPNTSNEKPASEAWFFDWIAADSKAAADQAFSNFYALYAKILIATSRKRFGGRIGLDVIEDAVSVAMLKALEMFGEQRVKALKDIESRLKSFPRFQLDELFDRRVGLWASLTDSIRLSVLDFYAHPPAQEDYDEAVSTVNERRSESIVQGNELVLNACSRQAGMASRNLEALRVHIKKASLADRALQWLETDQAVAVTVIDGVRGFCAVMSGMRFLKIITLAYFNVICMNEINRCLRGENRRPGMDSEDEDDEDSISGASPGGAHDLEHDDNDRVALGGAELIDESPNPGQLAEESNLFERLDEWLQRPVLEAEQRVASQTVKKERQRAEQKLLKAREEQVFNIHLLMLWMDGATQDEMAENLSVTRNQLRYAMEKLISTIQEFCQHHGLRLPQAISENSARAGLKLIRG
ncbi:MAG: hypothetical protein LBV49_02085 [Azonexus sp.]|jgi:hypothetical protein|nr:hypothetical protein [Azonexus sp.]